MNRTGLNLPIPPIVLAEMRTAYEKGVPPKVIAFELGFRDRGHRIYRIASKLGWSKGPTVFRLSAPARKALDERIALWKGRCCPRCGTPMRKRHCRCQECHHERETAPQDHETAGREAA